MPSTWALRSPVILSAEAVSVCSCNSFGAPLSVLSISYVTLLNASVAALEILELPACTCTLSLLLTLPLVSEPLLTTGHSASQVSPHSGHYSRQVTAHGRFLLTAGYCSLQVPAHGRSLLTASHCSQHVTAPRRPLPSAGHCSRHVTAHRGPLPSAGHCSLQVTVPVMPQLAAGHCSPQASRHHAPCLRPFAIYPHCCNQHVIPPGSTPAPTGVLFRLCWLCTRHVRFQPVATHRCPRAVKPNAVTIVPSE